MCPSSWEKGHAEELKEAKAKVKAEKQAAAKKAKKEKEDKEKQEKKEKNRPKLPGPIPFTNLPLLLSFPLSLCLLSRSIYLSVFTY